MNLDAIIIITNQCNLNCAHCVYACDLKPDPYYITIDELRNTLNLMKQKLPSLKKLVLSGGDAFMHPLILQICREVRRVFPDIELCAYTNGLLLSKISDSDILTMTKNLNLNIVTSLYPSIKNLEEYKNQDKRFKELGTELYYQFSHFYFNKQIYRYNNINIPKEVIDRQFYNNCRTLTKYNNLITIYKNKILVCCGEVGYVNNGKTNLDDLLDLESLISEKQILNFCEQPHNICKDCVADLCKSSCNVLWMKHNDLTEKYKKDSLKSVFIKNYQDYKKLLLNNKEQLFCYNDKFFNDKIDLEERKFLDIKYKNGIKDIYIPYYNYFDEQKAQILYNKLCDIPNIERYNLYFVGINTSSKINNLMFKKFHTSDFNSKLKSTFLLGNSLVHGYEEFINYSYLPNKILLDVNKFIKDGILE